MKSLYIECNMGAAGDTESGLHDKHVIPARPQLPQYKYADTRTRRRT